MEVVLPDTGCNILSASDRFYNVSADGTTRSTYFIYDGVAYLNMIEYGSYTTTGTCLHTGDLIYKPEIDVYFRCISFVFVFFIMFFIYKITLGRFIK